MLLTALTNVLQAQTSRTSLPQTGARAPAASFNQSPASSLYTLIAVDSCFLPLLLPAERSGVTAQPAVQTPARNKTDPQPHPRPSPRFQPSRKTIRTSPGTSSSYSHPCSATEPVQPLLLRPRPLLPRPPDPVSHHTLGTLGKQIASLRPSLSHLTRRPSINDASIVSSKLWDVSGASSETEVVHVLETDTFVLDN